MIRMAGYRASEPQNPSPADRSAWKLSDTYIGLASRTNERGKGAKFAVTPPQ